jgi:hypothetical protein
MTKATEILYSSRNANQADYCAQRITDKVDQDWANEATLYTFDDDSVLVITGPQLNAFASMADARAALETPAARFATIDLHSGYVWWVGQADSPAAACARSHADTGNTPAEFVECVNRDADAVYAVYEVPEGFDVDDGQDADAINATQAHPLAGHFRRSEIDADIPY